MNVRRTSEVGRTYCYADFTYQIYLIIIYNSAERTS